MPLTGMFGSPGLTADTLSARPYQIEALEAVRTEFKKGHHSTLVILPTGTGKTVLFSKISRSTVEKGGRVLILAHREELLQGAADTLERVGILAGIEKAESHARAAFDPMVVVASVQSMQRRRLASWPRDHFRLVIVDEAHHATAKSYQNIFNHFLDARFLGVTATPDRSDGDKLADVFDTVAYEMSIWDAMRAPEPGPYLSRLRFVQCDVGIDLRGIRTTGGDFNLADLEDRIRPMVDTLANAIRQEIGDRQTIVFTPDVGSCQAMATAMQSIGLRADWVSGSCPDRAHKVRKYKEGDTQVICCCMLLIEGFDAPATSAIAPLRITKSRSLYSQMIGRGTRLSPGKENCVIIDFNFLTESHDLCRPADLFDTTGTDSRILDIANEIARKPKSKTEASDEPDEDETLPGLDLMEVVEQAREEFERRQVIAIRAKEREVRYRKVSYDPLSAADALGIPRRAASTARHDPPTEGQVRTLEKFGVQGAQSMSKRRAGRMLDELITRAKAGKATYKQISHLIANGVEPKTARIMTLAEASTHLDALWGGKRKGA